MIVVLYWTAGIMLIVAAALTLWRLTVGPSTLDRIVSADVLISAVLVSLCMIMVIFDGDSSLPILLVMSMVAFTGGVSVARMLAPRAAERQRYRRDDQEGQQ